MKVRYGKLNDCFAIIPHIDIKWIFHSQFKLYYIQFAWLLWCEEIIISFIDDYDKQTKTSS